MVGKGFDFGGTADIDYIFHFVGLSCCDSNLAERNRYISECRLFLYAKLGAVLSADRWQVLYWPKKTRESVPAVIRNKRPMVILAGHMGHRRGRCWDRRRNN